MAKTRSKETGATTELSVPTTLSANDMPPSTPNYGLSLDVASVTATLVPATPAVASLSSEDRPKVLCLGMSYPSMERQLQSYNVDPKKWLEGRSVITVQDVLKCVREGMLTEMDARDLARCVATELTANVEIYTVSQEKAALYDSQRHLFANFNRHSFVHQLHVAFATDQKGNRQKSDENSRQRSFRADYMVRYRQAILDYFWIPQGWDDNHWSRSFFTDILPDLVRRGLMEIDDESNLNDNVPCGVYLPFCFHCFRQIVNALPLLRKYYAISFLRKTDLHEISLWKGTQTIDPYDMQKRLGKHRDQENIYCTFGYQEVMQAGTNARDEPKDTLVDILSRLEDFDDIRMIKLRPLRQHRPTINLPEEEHEKGGLKGLVNPKTVRNGFVATADASQDAKKCLEIKVQTNAPPKKTPNTPQARCAAATRQPSKTTNAKTCKRRRSPAASTPAKKKIKTSPAAAVAESPPPNTNRALFRGNTLAMPTRSRSRAMAASSHVSSGPTVPLYDANSSTPPRRSSRRHITFVSLPTITNKNRRPSVSSVSSVLSVRARQVSKQGERSSSKAAARYTLGSPQKGGKSSKPIPNALEEKISGSKTAAPSPEDDFELKKQHNGATHVAAHAAKAIDETSQALNDNSLEEETLPTRTSSIAAALPTENLEGNQVKPTGARTPSPSAAPSNTGTKKCTSTSATDKSTTLPSPSAVTFETKAKRSAKTTAEPIELPAVTPSPSAAPPKTEPRRSPRATTKPAARRSLCFQRPEQVDRRKGKEAPPRTKRVTRMQTKATERTASSLSSLQESKHEPRNLPVSLQGASSAAASLAALHQSDVTQTKSLTTEVRESKDQELSVLLATTEVSDSIASFGDESEDSVAKIGKTTPLGVSVLESLSELKALNDLVRPPVIIEPEFDEADALGLSTRERLEYLDKTLDPAARSDSAPQHRISIQVSPNPFIARKGHQKSSTKTAPATVQEKQGRKKKCTTKVPVCSKARREEWKAKKNESA